MFLDIIEVMNPNVLHYILSQLRSAGYDVHTELGDTVITQGVGPHAIYIQVRDGKKTYIPITLLPDTSEDVDTSQQISENTPMVTDSEISQVSVDEPKELQPSFPDPLETISEPELLTISEPVVSTLNDISDNTFTSTISTAPNETIWDENMTELLAKIQSTKETLRTLIQS